jgi:hypothetical protein
MDHDLILYQFSRSKVQRGDFRHFLNLYAPYKLPTGRRLRDMMNRFEFCIEGWDDDPREIHLIPEIRRFYAAFHEAWPYWFFFCNLDSDTMRAMVACCLASVNTMQVDGQAQVALTFDPQTCLKSGFTAAARRYLGISACRSMRRRRPQGPQCHDPDEDIDDDT